MLRIRGLTKSFPDRRGTRTSALDDVRLDVERGQFATVLGPSGCGKTTLLRTIAGFEQPDRGTISIDSKALVDDAGHCTPTHDRGVGIVPQDGALFPHLTAAGNIAFGLSGYSRRERKQRVKAILDLVGLPAAGPRRPHELSGGQQQRIALARALAPEPRVVLLDEPFSALDAQLRQGLRDEVRAILKSIGATVVLVTHDQAEALTLADHLVVMRQGHVVQADAPREAYLRPRDLELAEFLGEAVILPGKQTDPDTVTCAFGTLAVAGPSGTAGDCRVLIRPENIRVGAPDRAGTASGIIGTVAGQSFYGHDQMLHVAVGPMSDPVQVRVIGTNRFLAGDQVELHVDEPVQTFAC